MLPASDVISHYSPTPPRAKAPRVYIPPSELERLLPADVDAIASAIVSQEWRDQVAAEMVKINPDYATPAENFRMCGSRLGKIWRCPNNITHDAKPLMNHCDCRICPTDASRGSDRLQKHYIEPIRKIMEEHPHAGYKLRHIGLTTDVHADDPDAKDRYSALVRQIEPTLRDALCPLVEGERKKAWYQRWADMKKTIGWLVTDEFGEDNQHLHFHIAFYGPFIPQDALSDVWKAHTGYPIVYITLKDDAKALTEMLKYVTKFAVKGQLVAPATLAHIFHILYDRRRVRSYGLFFRLEEENETDEHTCCCSVCQAEMKPQWIRDWLSDVRDHLVSLQFTGVTADLCKDASGFDDITHILEQIILLDADDYADEALEIWHTWYSFSPIGPPS